MTDHEEWAALWALAGLPVCGACGAVGAGYDDGHLTLCYACLRAERERYWNYRDAQADAQQEAEQWRSR